MAFFIIEGLDRTGKTTITNRLRDQMYPRPQIVHYGVPTMKRHVLHDLCPVAYMYQPGDGHSLIFDRCHIGEETYGPMYRDGSRLTRAQRYWLDLFYQAKGVKAIHVTASEKTIRERCERVGEDYLNLDHINEMLTAYSFECSDNKLWTTFNTDLYPFQDKHYERLIKLIRLEAEALEVDAARIRATGTDYVGPMRPQVLLVADRPNFTDDLPTQYGSMIPWEGSEGEFLLNSLMSADVIHAGGESQLLGIVNGNPPADHEGREWQLATLWHILGEPPIVAVGNNAALKLEVIHMGYKAKVAHPKYVQRFNMSFMSSYGEVLRDAIKEAVSV